MSEKIDEIQQKLKEHGYFASKDLAKLVLLLAQCQEWGYKNPLTRLVALFS